MRSPLIALIRKELKGYFDQPTGYILMVVFVTWLSYGFFRSTFDTFEASLRPMFTTELTPERLSLPWLLALFVPASTMRLIAEEQRDGTLETLLTQPIRGWIVLLAKFLSGFIFTGVAIFATIGIPIALSTVGNMDQGAIIAQYVGSLFLAASFVSIGLFTSSITQNQIVAFIVGFFVILIMMSAGLDRVAVTVPAEVASLLQTLSPTTHFSSIARGVIDLRDILYFVALISTFLSATYLMIRSKSLSHVSPQYRNLQVGVAAFIVLSLLVGWFGSSIGGRLDLTEDKVFSLSKGTNQILSRLDDVLTVKLYESKDPPPQLALVTRDVNDFLEDFAARSDGKVKLVHKYPDEDEDVALEAQLAGVPPAQFNVFGQTEISTKLGYLGLTMTHAEQREVIQYIPSVDGFEYRLATAAYRMLQQDRKTVAFLAGHGEKSKDSELRTLWGLLSQQYDMVEIAAEEEEPVDLSGVDVLIVPGPTLEVPERDREALKRYLDGGGKAMILVDSVEVDPSRGLVAVPNQHSFADFLEPYGVLVEDNVVLDKQFNVSLPFSTALGSVLVPYPYWVKADTVDAKVTAGVQSAVMPWASSLGITDAEVGGVEVINLLRTRPTAAVDYAYGDVSPNSPQLEADRQEFESDMAVAVIGEAPDGPGDGSERGKFRIVVVGDSDWITDNVSNQAQQNLALGLNLVDWLAQEETLAAIRSKVVASRELDFGSSTRQNVIQYANIAGVPAGFVLIGLLMFVRRRRKSVKVYRREG